MRVEMSGVLFVTAVIAMTSATSAGVRQEGIEKGRLTDSRPRRDVTGFGAPGDEEYGGRFAPLNKRPFGSLFNNGLGKRSGIEEEEEVEEMIPEEDDILPAKRMQSVLGGGFKLGKRPNLENMRTNDFSLGKRQLGGILGGGYKFGKRNYGNVLGRGFKFGKRGLGGILGGGYKFGKRGLGSVLGGGFKFGKRGLGGVLGGGYKFGKRDMSDEVESDPTPDNRLEMAKRPWGNLFGKSFQYGKRQNSGSDRDMGNVYRALLSRRYANDASYEPESERGGVMKNAVSIAKRLFGNVLSNGYKLG